MAESFQYNSLYPVTEIEQKIRGLSEDIIIINRDANCSVYTNYSSMYPVKFHSEYTVEDFLCRPTDVKKNVDRDVVNAFQKIFQRAVNTNITSEEVIATLLPWHDETICHGLIAFHPVDNISNELQLIYGLDSWYKFKRHFLGLYPKIETFIDECFKCFPNLFFHDRNRQTVADILDDFTLSIIKHLGILNDVFYWYRQKPFVNESIKYQTLTIECNLEAPAAAKDNNDAKGKLTFEFIDNKGQKEKVTCYPHLRLCRSDNPGDTNYYQNRIYFHEGMDNIERKKILIGHIGLHL